MKANHNQDGGGQFRHGVVSSTTKIVKWKQITTRWWRRRFDSSVVSSTTKIVKWKQITTYNRNVSCNRSCFQYDKDSKMKANHNASLARIRSCTVVSSTTKIVKWKQITTKYVDSRDLCRCFQYDKDSKMKANHNLAYGNENFAIVVSSTTKIVKWKQITTAVVVNVVNVLLFPVRQR